MSTTERTPAGATRRVRPPLTRGPGRSRRVRRTGLVPVRRTAAPAPLSVDSAADPPSGVSAPNPVTALAVVPVADGVNPPDVGVTGSSPVVRGRGVGAAGRAGFARGFRLPGVGATCKSSPVHGCGVRVVVWRVRVAVAAGVALAAAPAPTTGHSGPPPHIGNRGVLQPFVPVVVVVQVTTAGVVRDVGRPPATTAGPRLAVARLPGSCRPVPGKSTVDGPGAGAATVAAGAAARGPHGLGDRRRSRIRARRPVSNPKQPRR